MTEMKEGAFVWFYRVYMTAIGTLSLITAVLFATHVVSVAVYPEVTPPDVNVTVDEDLLKSWHLSYSEEFDGDWLGPFQLTGERARVSWAPAESTGQPGQLAQFCHALDRACVNEYVEVGESREIVVGGALAEGWYYLSYGSMTGSLKAIEVYLYY